MKVSSAHFIKRRTTIVGWLTIFTQAALPLSFAYSPLVNAATSQDPSSKWYQSGNDGQNGQSLFENHGNTLASAGSALSEGNAAGIARSVGTYCAPLTGITEGTVTMTTTVNGTPFGDSCRPGTAVPAVLGQFSFGAG